MKIDFNSGNNAMHHSEAMTPLEDKEREVNPKDNFQVLFHNLTTDYTASPINDVKIVPSPESFASPVSPDKLSRSYSQLDFDALFAEEDQWGNPNGRKLRKSPRNKSSSITSAIGK